MTTFLQHVASSLLARYGSQLSNLVVVFPGKRASLFLDQALAEASATPVWTPTYRTISELFTEASPYTLCDTLESVCRLYRSYTRFVENPQPLDQFYGWGEILLSDFDDIDKQLVDARQLFANIHDLHSIEDNSYITPEQEKALKAFFSNFSLEKNSELRERFLQLWQQLPHIYDDLNTTMRADGLLYEGALQRDIIASITPTKIGTSSPPASSSSSSVVSDRFPVGTVYAFVGFNVLNAVEQALFDELQRRGQALFFWDYDQFYTPQSSSASAPANDADNPFFREAGYFLGRNLRRYGNALSPECFDNLRTAKHLSIVITSSENAQARYLPQWLSHNLTDQENQTAVVLCNESLLQPVLHSIPSGDLPLNITMGYPLADTPVHSFILSLLSLQIEGYDASLRRFRPSFLRAVISHPYSQLIESDMWQHPVSQCRELLLYLQDILTSLAPQLRDDLIATESIFRVYTCINRLLDLMSGETPLLSVAPPTLVRLLRGILHSNSIPFHGEPATGIQIMGVLETRALDFRHILMLSVGEGFLPKKADESSFIPYFLREAFGLTTQQNKIAVYAYYFYRLIQRAEHVTFMYNESNTGIRQNEISRFLRQLLAETDFTIQHYVLQAASYAHGVEPVVKFKTTEVLQRLRSMYDNTGRVGKNRRFLSPSALNTYTTCPMKFYYRFIEGMRIDPNPSDGLDAILFGEVFHRAAELIYLSLTSANDVIRKQDLDFYLELGGQRLEPFVRQAFREKFFNQMPEEYRGILLIAYRVITAYLLQLLRHDSRLTPFRVLGLEVQQTKTLHIQGMEIDTGGIIDRLDLINDDNVAGGQVVRVVDYKTGGRPDSVASFDRLFFNTDQKAHYHFQTILYASIVAEHYAQPVMPCLFFVHRSNTEDYKPQLKLEGQIIYDVRQPLDKRDDASPLSQTFMSRLESLVEKIFDPDKPFIQTTEIKECELCEFRSLCMR